MSDLKRETHSLNAQRASGYERTEGPQNRRDVDVGELIANIRREELRRQLGGALGGLWYCVVVVSAMGLMAWIGRCAALAFPAEW